MAHNNFVMHFENKMYRLRETGLYPFDFDAEYSSLSAKYLVLELYPGRPRRASPTQTRSPSTRWSSSSASPTR